MFESLPVELEFDFNPGATVYPPNRITPTEIRGRGRLLLLFEESDESDVLSVRISDLHFRFHPFEMPVRLGGDGHMVSIEVRELELDSSYLDCDASVGTLDLRTGEIELEFSYQVTAEKLPILKVLEVPEITVSVTDRGIMDLRTGRAEIHSDALDLDFWPLEGAVARGGGVISTTPAPTNVDLNVVVHTPGATACGDISNKSVIVCPDDRVILCWSSSVDVKSIELDPGSLALPKDGVHTPPPVGRNDIIYLARAIGGNSKAEDSVEVHVYGGEWLGPYQAIPDGFRWVIEIPPTSISGQIHIEELQLQPQGCLDWNRFLLEHVPPGSGAPDLGLPIEGNAAIRIDPPVSAAGRWYFTPRLDPPKVTPVARVNEALPVCFRIRGQCRR